MVLLAYPARLRQRCRRPPLSVTNAYILGFRVLGVKVRVQGLGVSGLGFWDCGFRVWSRTSQESMEAA